MEVAADANATHMHAKSRLRLKWVLHLQLVASSHSSSLCRDEKKLKRPSFWSYRTNLEGIETLDNDKHNLVVLYTVENAAGAVNAGTTCLFRFLNINLMYIAPREVIFPECHNFNTNHCAAGRYKSATRRVTFLFFISLFFTPSLCR